MNPNTRDLGELARQARSSDTPHRVLADLLLRLQQAGARSVHATAVERMLACAPELDREQAWAAEMQLGAEGFDNTMSARAYNDVQECLRQAGRQLARACEILLAQD